MKEFMKKTTQDFEAKLALKDNIKKKCIAEGSLCYSAPGPGPQFVFTDPCP